MKQFDDLYRLACDRKGGARALEALLPEVASAEWLKQQPDAFYLSAMTRRVFRAGLKHSLVDARWPAFEQAFFGFDPEKLVLMPDAMLDERMQDRSLIRHWGKMKAIRHNAQFVHDVARAEGSCTKSASPTLRTGTGSPPDTTVTSRPRRLMPRMMEAARMMWPMPSRCWT